MKVVSFNNNDLFWDLGGGDHLYNGMIEKGTRRNDDTIYL